MNKITIYYDKYTTEYQKYILDRFSESVPEVVDFPYDEETRKNHHVYGNFIYVLEASKPYGVEKEILAFGKAKLVSNCGKADSDYIYTFANIFFIHFLYHGTYLRISI